MFYFEEEHNTAWYLINAKLTGELVLDIIPTDTLNDVDFILFNNIDTSFCRNSNFNQIIRFRFSIKFLCF